MYNSITLLYSEINTVLFNNDVCMLSHSVVSILCNPMDCSLPGSSLHGIFQAWILEWVANSFSKTAILQYNIKKLKKKKIYIPVQERGNEHTDDVRHLPVLWKVKLDRRNESDKRMEF